MRISARRYRLIALVSVIFASISAIGVVITVYLIIEQLDQARIALEEAKITRAWSTLTIPSPYNTGRIEAIELLAVSGQDLKRINVSCKEMTYGRPEGHTKCGEDGVLTYLDGLNLSVQNIGRRVDLSGSILDKSSFTGADFSGVILPAASFRGARLNAAKFVKAQLTKAQFQEAYASKINLEAAILTGALLNDATFPCAGLKEAKLLRASLINIDLSSTRDCNTDLSNANLFRANLTRADVSGANLSNADLTNADLTGADLTGANLSGTDFTDATLSETNLRCAWAWEDLLPSEEGIITENNIYQYDEEIHRRDTRPALCTE